MLAVAVLAAGKGTRMKSALPKVLQPLAGATLVERVLASCDRLSPERRLLIVGHQAERVERSLAQHSDLEFVLQQPQNGTGHAVQQLLGPLAGFGGDLLVLNGDVPLLRPETLEQLLEQHRASAAAVTMFSAPGPIEDVATMICRRRNALVKPSAASAMPCSFCPRHVRMSLRYSSSATPRLVTLP